MLSIITVGRADNHTGNFVDRLLYTAEFNARALKDAGIKHQFIFVEWNSPREALGTVARKYTDAIPNSIAYVVDPGWHNFVCDNPNMVIMEFFAKNVGLRRCETPVAVCVNADILFGNDTIKLMGMWRKCENNVMYRTLSRKDIKSDRTYTHPNELDDPSRVPSDRPGAASRCQSSTPALGH